MSDDEEEIDNALIRSLVTLVEFEPLGRALFYHKAQPVDKVATECFKDLDFVRDKIVRCRDALKLKEMASLLQSKINGEDVNEREMRKISQNIDFDSLSPKISETIHVSLVWYANFSMFPDEWQKKPEDLVAELYEEAERLREKNDSNDQRDTAFIIKDCLTTLVQCPPAAQVLWSGDVRRALNAGIEELTGRDAAKEIYRTISALSLKNVAIQLADLSKSSRTSYSLTKATALIRQVDLASLSEEYGVSVLHCFGILLKLKYSQDSSHSRTEEALSKAAKEIERISTCIATNP